MALNNDFKVVETVAASAYAVECKISASDDGGAQFVQALGWVRNCAFQWFLNWAHRASVRSQRARLARERAPAGHARAFSGSNPSFGAAMPTESSSLPRHSDTKYRVERISFVRFAAWPVNAASAARYATVSHPLVLPVWPFARCAAPMSYR